MSIPAVASAERVNKRDEILTAAAILLSERGYAATTLRNIAEAADIKAGSVYYHFKSKEAIVGEILDIGVRVIYDAVREATDSAPPDADDTKLIRLAISTHLKSLLGHSVYTYANYRTYYYLPDELKAAHRPLRREYEGLWDELLGRAQASGQIRSDIDPKALRRFVMGALNKTVEWYDASQYSIDELSEMIASFIIEGLQDRP